MERMEPQANVEKKVPKALEVFRVSGEKRASKAKVVRMVQQVL
jgi:hypothetical protein